MASSFQNCPQTAKNGIETTRWSWNIKLEPGKDDQDDDLLPGQRVPLDPVNPRQRARAFHQVLGGGWLGAAAYTWGKCFNVMNIFWELICLQKYLQ